MEVFHRVGLATTEFENRKKSLLIAIFRLAGLRSQKQNQSFLNADGSKVKNC